MTSVAKPVSETDIRAFEKAGAVCLRGYFDSYWVERMRDAIERRIAQGAEALSRRQAAFSFTELFMARSDSDFREFVFASPAASIAAQLMRSRTVRFYFDQIFNKEPGLNEPSPWHNDQPYYPVQGSQVCSVWLALDHVTRESSGLQYIAGSHRWNPPVLGDIGDPAERGEAEKLCWDMQPGDCLVHGGFTVHGAEGNTTTDRRRRALATRWIGDDVVYRERTQGRSELQIAGLRTGDPIVSSENFPEIALA